MKWRKSEGMLPMPQSGTICFRNSPGALVRFSFHSEIGESPRCCPVLRSLRDRCFAEKLATRSGSQWSCSTSCDYSSVRFPTDPPTGVAPVSRRYQRRASLPTLWRNYWGIRQLAPKAILSVVLTPRDAFGNSGMSEPLPNRQSEETKRLQPKGEVLRELFLKSGNLCAFPGCAHLIMDPNGAFVGEICHIEAAESGGERFNPKQTNEQRRELGNLLLLCHRHHVITNNVKEFTVERMQQLKRYHESKVNDFATHLQFRVTDLTKREVEKPTVMPRKLASVCNWSLTDEELTVTAADLNKVLAVLREVPIQARHLLVVAVERSEGPDNQGRRHFSPEEVDLACGLTARKTGPLWGVLDRYGFAWDFGENETGRVKFALVSPQCDWNVWDTFLEFQDAIPGAIHELVVGLNFALLD